MSNILEYKGYSAEIVFDAEGHRAAVLAARRKKESLNRFVADAIAAAV